MGTNIFDLVKLAVKFDLLSKNFDLGHSFLTRRGRDFIYTLLVTLPFHGYQIFDLVTLTLKFDLLKKKL